MQGAQVQEALNNAIDAGIIPPTIIVGPSLNVDEEAHDCADIEGAPPSTRGCPTTSPR